MTIQCVAVHKVSKKDAVVNIHADFLLGGLVVLRGIMISAIEESGVCRMVIPQVQSPGAEGYALGFPTTYSRVAFESHLALAVCEFACQNQAIQRFNSVAEAVQALAMVAAKPAAGGVN